MMYVIISFLAVWFLSVFLLHFLKKDFTPYNHTCSEYAIGKFGWIINIGFFAMAAANILLAVQFMNKNLFACFLLLIVGLGFIGVGIFKADLTITDKPRTTAGRIHSFFGITAFIVINIATFVLASHNNDLLLWIFAGVCLLTLLIFAGSLKIKRPLFFGLAQRMFLLMITVWLAYVSIKFV